MEQAYYLMNIADFNTIPEEYSRVYVGWEFCPNFILGRDDIDRILSLSMQYNKKVTFVIPFIFQKELKRARSYISYLGSLNKNIEVVFNDWGVYRLIKKEHFLQPVLGRLLSKQKLGLDPQIVQKLNLSTLDQNYLKKSAINSLNAFLIENSIFRVELSYSPFGINLEDIDPNIKVSLHYPLSYVSTSRYCRIFCTEQNMPLEKIEKYSKCPRFCIKNNSLEYNKQFSSNRLLLQGNTVFIYHPSTNALKQAKNIENIDRTVFSPIETNKIQQ